MVRKLLPSDQLRVYPPLGQIVHILLPQMGIPHRNLHLRGRLRRLWRRSHLECADRRTSHCGCRICRDLHRRSDHHRVHRSAHQTTSLHWHHWRHVRNRLRSWTSPRRSLHRPRQLEVVFLYQPSHRSHHHRRHWLLLQVPETEVSVRDDVETEA